MEHLLDKFKNPKRNILLATFLLILVALSEIVVLLAIAVSVNPRLSDFEVGFYTEIAKMIAGDWLAILLVASALTSLIGVPFLSCAGITHALISQT